MNVTFVLSADRQWLSITQKPGKGDNVVEHMIVIRRSAVTHLYHCPADHHVIVECGSAKALDAQGWSGVQVFELFGYLVAGDTL